MGDRVAVLRDGTVQQLATPLELYESPANLFVASFIGSPPMNLYEAEISGPATELVVSLGSQRLALPADIGHRCPGLLGSKSRKLVVGIRPEHLTIADPASTGLETTLAARVELVEILGNELLVHYSTDARTVRNRAGAWTADSTVQGEIAGASAAEGVARVDPRVPVMAGDRITLAVDVGRMSFFDAATGDAIRANGSGGIPPHAALEHQGRTRKQGA